jgi:hypothetical protein
MQRNRRRKSHALAPLKLNHAFSGNLGELKNRMALFEAARDETNSVDSL